MNKAPALRARPWSAVAAVVAVALACGFTQTLPVATLAEVARHFGHQVQGASLAEQAGLSGSVLGLGLALLRIAAIGGMPIAAFADRIGRRPVMLRTAAYGFGASLLAAFAPSYWTLVLAFALARPLITAAMAVAQVAVVELAPQTGRSVAAGALAAGYGLGGGLAAIADNTIPSSLGFRFLYCCSLVPLLGLYLLSRRISEPEHYLAAISDERPRLRALDLRLRRRAVQVAALTFLLSMAAGPANSFLFVYAKNVVHVPRSTIAIMVAASAVTGIFGLIVGRRIADRHGRRPALALAIVLLVSASLVLYAGSREAVIIGYLFGVMAGGLISPAATPFINELFPTRARASVAGVNIVAGVAGAVVGLLWFGLLAQHLGFSSAAWLTFPLALPALLVLAKLPETLGHSLSETPA